VILLWVGCALRWSERRSRSDADRPYTCCDGRSPVDWMLLSPRNAGASDPTLMPCPPAPRSNCALTSTSGNRALGTASPQLTNLRYNYNTHLSLRIVKSTLNPDKSWIEFTERSINHIFKDAQKTVAIEIPWWFTYLRTVILWYTVADPSLRFQLSYLSKPRFDRWGGWRI